MTKVNGIEVPTCAELGEMLIHLGDRPLYNGNGWFVVQGFCPSSEGIRVSAVKCQPGINTGSEQRK